ncbi:CHT1 [Mytilus edulis]|uniref:SLC5A7 n=1 Tax=Mytilus edulis TaxID=6550 RepID=A0A8S3UH39_MYTED|nr:CHT1 [Mytilus edulis]
MTQMLMPKNIKAKKRERINQQYYFNGHQICRKTFLFAHTIGKSQLDSISKSLEKKGLKPRTHGNTVKTPKHALAITDMQRVKHFIQEYGVKFGVPLPGRLPNHKDLKVTLLPSDKTKADIHQIYQEAASSLNYRAISLSEFKKLWLEQCPQIVLMKPATDLCSACQSFTVSLSNTGNMTEEEKTILLQNYGGHVVKAKKQRDYYRDQCQESKENYTQLPDNQRNRVIHVYIYNLFENRKMCIFVNEQASDRELTWVLRFSIVVVGTLGAVIAISANSIYGLYILCADAMYVVQFPVLTCALWVPFANTYGAISGLVVGTTLRVLGGEPVLSFPSIIKYPGYNDTLGQIFPYKTFSMLSCTFSLLSISYLTEYLITTKRTLQLLWTKIKSM